METLHHLVDQTSLIVWISVLAIAVLGVLYIVSRRAGFHWLLFRYDIPLFGKLARLGRAGDQRAGGSKWYLSERELCQDFHEFHHEPPAREQYDRATAYLSKVQELGRRELPVFGWLVIFVLLTAEALSFGILLAGYIAQSASLNQQTWLGYLAATVLAIILLALTHTAGRQMHNNSLISKAREWFRGRQAEEQGKALRPYPGVSLEDNSVDDREPIYVQVAGRVVDHSGGRFQPSYLWIVLATVVVLGFGGLSFYIRAELFNQLQTQETLGQTAEGRAGGAEAQDINKILGGQTANGIKQGEDESQTSGARAAIAAFGALALLFFAMQVVGVSVGYFFGFSGRESKAAMRIRGPYRTADEYLKFERARRDYVAHHAQVRLTALQRKIRAATNDANFDQNASERTFRTYVIEQRQARSREEEYLSTSPMAGQAAPQLGPVIQVEVGRQSSAQEAELRRRIELEVAQKLERERLEKTLRLEIETRLRAEMGADKTS